jgi:hypothetical protein
MTSDCTVDAAVGLPIGLDAHLKRSRLFIRSHLAEWLPTPPFLCSIIIRILQNGAARSDAVTSPWVKRSISDATSYQTRVV